MQVDGATMGSPVGKHAYKLVPMSSWENVARSLYNRIKPIYYRSDISDIFEPWTQQNFLDYLNNQRSNIKFTKENKQNESIPFLDMNISHSNGQLSNKHLQKIKLLEARRCMAFVAMHRYPVKLMPLRHSSIELTTYAPYTLYFLVSYHS